VRPAPHWRVFVEHSPACPTPTTPTHVSLLQVGHGGSGGGVGRTSESPVMNVLLHGAGLVGTATGEEEEDVETGVVRVEDEGLVHDH
jgi:hypothetical protein